MATSKIVKDSNNSGNISGTRYSPSELYTNTSTLGWSIGLSSTGDTENPTTSGGWYIISIKESENYGMQIATQSNTNKVFVRTKFGGTWGSWAQL